MTDKSVKDVSAYIRQRYLNLPDEFGENYMLILNRYAKGASSEPDRHTSAQRTLRSEKHNPLHIL